MDKKIKSCMVCLGPCEEVATKLKAEMQKGLLIFSKYLSSRLTVLNFESGYAMCEPCHGLLKGFAKVHEDFISTRMKLHDSVRRLREVISVPRGEVIGKGRKGTDVSLKDMVDIWRKDVLEKCAVKLQTSLPTINLVRTNCEEEDDDDDIVEIKVEPPEIITVDLDESDSSPEKRPRDISYYCSWCEQKFPHHRSTHLKLFHGNGTTEGLNSTGSETPPNSPPQEKQLPASRKANYSSSSPGVVISQVETSSQVRNDPLGSPGPSPKVRELPEYISLIGERMNGVESRPIYYCSLCDDDFTSQLLESHRNQHEAAQHAAQSQTQNLKGRRLPRNRGQQQKYKDYTEFLKPVGKKLVNGNLVSMHHCSICNVDVPKSSLTMHKRKHGFDLLPCGSCELTFPRRRQLDKHMSLVHSQPEGSTEERAVQKLKANAKTTLRMQPQQRRGALAPFLTRVGSEYKYGKLSPVYYCSICKKNIPGNFLTLHKRSHGVNRLACNFCPQTFYSARDRTVHENRDHSQEVMNPTQGYLPLPTPPAPKTQHSETLKTSPAQKTPLPTYISRVGKKLVRGRIQYFFRCSRCNVEFPHGSLTMHKRKHGDSLIPCFKCGLGFTQRRDMEKHMSLEHAEEVDAGSAAPSNSNTEVHEGTDSVDISRLLDVTLTEVSEPPIEDSSISFSDSFLVHGQSQNFSGTSSLGPIERSQLSRGNMPPYIRRFGRELKYGKVRVMYHCSLCDKKISYNFLTQHKRFHGLDLLQCDFCSQRFSSRSSWRKHMEKDHPTPAPVIVSVQSVKREVYWISQEGGGSRRLEQ